MVAPPRPSGPLTGRAPRARDARAGVVLPAYTKER